MKNEVIREYKLFLTQLDFDFTGHICIVTLSTMWHPVMNAKSAILKESKFLLQSQHQSLYFQKSTLISCLCLERKATGTLFQQEMICQELQKEELSKSPMQKSLAKFFWEQIYCR